MERVGQIFGRVLAGLVLFTTVHAQWVQFEACGLRVPENGSIAVYGYFKPAPNFKSIWVWVPAITHVTEFREYSTKTRCTALSFGEFDILVIGEGIEIMKKLGVK